jgi:hypothetical protein
MKKKERSGNSPAGEKISHYLQAENFHAIYPAIQPVKIFVREDHWETAKEPLFSLDLHAAAVSLTTESDGDEEKKPLAKQPL